MWLQSLKVAQLLRSAACLHTNQSRSYLNHLVLTVSQYLPYSPQRIAVHHVCCLCDPEKLRETLDVADDLLQYRHTEVRAYFKALFPGKWIGREGPIP